MSENNNQSSNSKDDQLPVDSVNQQGNDPGLTPNNPQDFSQSNQQGFQQSNQQDFSQNIQQEFQQFDQQGFPQNNQQGFQQFDQQGFQQNNQQGFQQFDQQGFPQNNQQGFQQFDQQGFQQNNQQGFQQFDQQGFQQNNQQGFQQFNQQGFPQNNQQNFQNTMQDAWSNGQQGNTYQNEFQMNEPFNSVPQTNLPPKKKKKKWKVAAAIFGGLVVVLGVVGFIFFPQLSNAFALYTMSAEDYYAKVEKKNMESSIDSTTQYIELMEAQYKEMIENGVGYEYSLKATIDSSIAQTIGIDELSNVELKMNGNFKDNTLQSNFETFINDTSLISANVLANMEDTKAFMQIKELSDKYISIPIESTSAYSDFGSLYSGIDYTQLQEAISNINIDKDTQRRMLERYSDAIIESINDVSLDKSVKVSINGTSSKQTKIVCTIAVDDLKGIISNILASAKDDKDLQKILIDSGICNESDYASTISMLSLGIQSYDFSNIDMEPIKMTVWVDGKGNITGREFEVTSADETVAIGSQKSTDGNKTAYKAWVKEAGETFMEINGSHTTKSKLVTGSCDITVNSVMTDPIHIEYSNLGVKDIMAGAITGKIAITNSSLLGGAINIDFDYKDKTSSMNFAFNQDDKDLFSLNLAFTMKPYEEVQFPNDSDVYDSESDTDMDKYISESKMDEYLQYLSDNFSWLQGYIDQFGSSILDDLNGYDDSLEDYEDEYDDYLDDNETDDDVTDSEDSATVEADYDEIMAAGIPSNGMTSLGVKGDDLTSTLQNTYFADGFYDTDEYMSNTVSNYGTTDLTYYTTYDTFYYDDSFVNSLQMVSDTVNNDLYSVTFWDTDYDRFESMIMDTLQYVNPNLSESDIETAKSKLAEFHDSETSTVVELGNLYISIDKYDTSYYCDISYNSMP